VNFLELSVIGIVLRANVLIPTGSQISLVGAQCPSWSAMSGSMRNYLKYQNRRAEYVDNFARIINWQKVEDRFNKFCAGR